MLKQNVLRRKTDFDETYRNGRSVGDRYVVVFCRENGLPYHRTGFLASKKVGNSVARNRARRLMKESFRHILPGLDAAVHYDMIFIARSTIAGRKCQDVERSVRAALRRTGVIKA